MSKSAEQGGQFEDHCNTSRPFNSTRQTGADGADLTGGLRPLLAARLRPDAGTGQRQGAHHGAGQPVCARNRGNTGTDLSTIPMLCIDSVQVLRDGAAAQYGSDAIASVIDITLRSAPAVRPCAGVNIRRVTAKILASFCGFRHRQRQHHQHHR